MALQEDSSRRMSVPLPLENSLPPFSCRFEVSLNALDEADYCAVSVFWSPDNLMNSISTGAVAVPRNSVTFSNNTKMELNREDAET